MQPLLTVWQANNGYGDELDGRQFFSEDAKKLAFSGTECCLHRIFV